MEDSVQISIPDNDRLALVLQGLKAELSACQADLIACQKKFEEEMKPIRQRMNKLQSEIAVLDHANVLIVSKLSAGQAAALRKIESEQKPSLKEDVIRCVDMVNLESGEGVTAAAVAKMLREILGYTPEKPRSFYTSVFITLDRLAKEGKVRRTITETGRVYSSVDKKTQGLFANEDIMR